MLSIGPVELPHEAVDLPNDAVKRSRDAAELSRDAASLGVDDLVRALSEGDPRFDLTTPSVLRSGLARVDGSPLVGRAGEVRLLRAAGYSGLPFGRLYEGHVNALQLIARCGTAAQRYAAARDVERGRLFGVWNTEPADGVRVASSDASGLRLAGRKTFCSGAGRVGGALITAKSGAAGRSGPNLANGANGMQMAVVDMEREQPPIERAFWQPMGMEDSDSYAVDFTGVLVRPDEMLGVPGDYERAPWFGAGAARFVAVQTGGVERIVDEYAAWLREGERSGDPLAVARLGSCAVAARTAHAWTQECAAAWEAYDRGAVAEDELAVTVDAARVAVERAALDVAEAVERGVGARGLLEPAPFSHLLCDLRMYLRQPAPDQALMRVARSLLDRSPAR
jgi:alkylation response protein AidB-like acyl-CoA dehydrogenase